MALKLATEFLMPGGTFVTKVFRSKDYNKLMWVFNQLFTKVEATKPPASRNVSAEIFVVCRGFKAPQKLDPKFLDPRSVFEELPDPTPNAEAKIFHPEKRKRQREGYDDDATFYNEASAMEFVETSDPLQMLSSTSRITWTDEASKKLRFKEATTKEIVACCEDLKVLGKKDFRSLLKWRLTMRDDLGLSAKKQEKVAEPTETVTITEDDQITAEMSRLSAQEQATKKRERRKLNERKQKEITRMQLGMLTPHELGMEQDAMDSDEIFGLKKAEQNGAMAGLLSGAVPEESDEEMDSMDIDEDYDTDDEVNDLEKQLDVMYNQYQERKAETNAKYKAKRAREEVEEWNGIDESSGVKQNGDASSSDSESEFENDVNNPVDTLLTSLGPRLDARSKGKLSQRAALFFDQPDFEGIDLDEPEETSDLKEQFPQEAAENGVDSVEAEKVNELGDSASDDGFEVVPAAEPDQDPWNDDSDDEKSPAKPSKSVTNPFSNQTRHRYSNCGSNDTSPPTRNRPKNQSGDDRRVL